MKPPGTFGSADLPVVGFEVVLGAIGGGSIFESVKNGNNWAQIVAFGLGATMGFWTGYHVAIHLDSPSCGDSQAFLEAVSKKDWRDIADAYFSQRYQAMEEPCHLNPGTKREFGSVSCFLGGEPEYELANKVHCGGPHITLSDYKYLIQKQKACTFASRF
jgi:hypothetical protein